jgi:hypothetical protein
MYESLPIMGHPSVGRAGGNRCNRKGCGVQSKPAVHDAVHDGPQLHDAGKHQKGLVGHEEARNVPVSRRLVQETGDARMQKADHGEIAVGQVLQAHGGELPKHAGRPCIAGGHHNRCQADGRRVPRSCLLSDTVPLLLWTVCSLLLRRFPSSLHHSVSRSDFM